MHAVGENGLSKLIALTMLAAALCLPAAGVQAAAAQQQVDSSDRHYYRIGPSDLLEVIVWKEVAVSRSDLLVRPDGRISMPLVDDVLVAGSTPEEVKEIITEHLRKYLELPQVYVTVKDPRSQYCCVLGNVREPGRYQMLTPTNVLQALAQAGGFNEWADKDEVVVIRGSGAEQKRLSFDYSEVVSGDRPEQNFRLQPGDVIVVP
jgi:polysaccharide export outer membrane protein